MRAVLTLLLLTGTAWGQPPLQLPKTTMPQSLQAVTPALYWARLSMEIAASMPPQTRSGLRTKVQVVLDDQGAVSKVALRQPSGDAAYDLAVLDTLGLYKPTAKKRLPLPKQPKLRAQVQGEGVLLSIRATPRKAPRLMPLPNALIKKKTTNQSPRGPTPQAKER